jgi:serine protease AprX
VRAGLVVVAAAGNYGQTADGTMVYGAITSPANSPYAIAVGAIDTHGTAQRSDDTLAAYSSKGPTRYDLILKPDLAAPGSHIRSAESAGSYLSQTYPARHVSGTGADAVMQLSGTSMSAGFVSGAAALVLDARGTLTPRDTKAALQVTSTFMPSAGLVGAGAGMINALAAVELMETNELPATTIGGERTISSGIFTTTGSGKPVLPLAQTHSSGRKNQRHTARQIRSGTTSGNTIVWGIEGNTIVRGGAEANTIVWGINANIIVWGGAKANTIVWGIDANTIVWGGAKANTIVWGIDANTIVWGGAKANTIVWGIDANTIVWGGAKANTIVWGIDANTIVWGGAKANTIVWGIGANTIVWGVVD